MYYEDVIVKGGDTVSGLSVAYGHKASAWQGIWDAHENLSLRAERGKPEAIRARDVLMTPIPWRVVSKSLTVKPTGVLFVVKRNGGRGKRLRWVQTVYQHNQPIGATSAHCVDGCPADDNDPFYWTDAELTANASLRLEFRDHPKRPAPTAANGTTRWRAILSIGVVTGKRVTVYDSMVWGFNRKPSGTVTKVGPRLATGSEVRGHLALLRKGKGTGADTFGKQGWTFRTPPRQVGDFPMPNRAVRYA